MTAFIMSNSEISIINSFIHSLVIKL